MVFILTMGAGMNDLEREATSKEIEKLNLDRARQRVKITELEKVIIDLSGEITETRQQIQTARDILKELIEV